MKRPKCSLLLATLH